MAGLGSGTNYIPGWVNIPSTVNSTETATNDFNGTFELVYHPWALITCYSDDQDGTVTVSLSNNGTTTHSTITKAVTAGVPSSFEPLLIGYRYIKVDFDSGSAPTTLSLLTSFGFYHPGVSQLGSTLAADAGSQIVRSVDSGLDLAFGRFGGMTEDTKFGFVRDIDAADNSVTVWAFANDGLSTRSDRKPFPTSAATLYIVSDDAGDTDLDFDVEVINGSGVRSTVSVSTDASDGTTPVSFAASAGMDVNRAELVGDTQTHAGNIYITNANDFTAGVPNDPTNDVLAFIPAGYGQTQQVAYFVPSGFKCRIKRFVITVARASGASGSADLEFLVKKPSQSWVVKREYSIQTGQFEVNCAGLVFDALTRWEWVLEDASDTDTNVSIDTVFELVAV